VPSPDAAREWEHLKRFRDLETFWGHAHYPESVIEVRHVVGQPETTEETTSRKKRIHGRNNFTGRNDFMEETTARKKGLHGRNDFTEETTLRSVDVRSMERSARVERQTKAIMRGVPWSKDICFESICGITPFCLCWPPQPPLRGLEKGGSGSGFFFLAKKNKYLIVYLFFLRPFNGLQQYVTLPLCAGYGTVPLYGTYLVKIILRIKEQLTRRFCKL
jgi:hypothetical protein